MSTQQWRNRAFDLRAAAAAVDFAQTGPTADAIVSTYEFGHGFSMAAATKRVAWMLYGMALEAMMKAAMVARRQNPPAIHDLIKLADGNSLVLTEKQRGMLEVLSHAIIWFGRYPVPKASKRADVDKLGATLSEVAWSPLTESSLIKKWNGAMDWNSLEELWALASDFKDGDA